MAGLWYEFLMEAPERFERELHERYTRINSQHCVPINGSLCTEAKLFFPGWNTKTNLPVVALTAYAKEGRGEYWAEALAVWAYDSDCKKAALYSLQETAMEWIMQE